MHTFIVRCAKSYTFAPHLKLIYVMYRRIRWKNRRVGNIDKAYIHYIIYNSSLKFEIKAKQFYAASQRVL